MNAARSMPTNSDVVFGKIGRPPTAATQRFREIRREYHQAYRNAGKDEKRNIEKSILKQIRKELPTTARFLQFFAAGGNDKEESYRLMTDNQVLDAVAVSFVRRYCYQQHKNKVSQKKVDSAVLSSHNRACQGSHKDLLKTTDSPAAKTARQETNRVLTIFNTTTTQENTIVSTKRPMEATTAESPSKKARRVSLLMDIPHPPSATEIFAHQEKALQLHRELANDSKQATIDFLVYENAKMKEMVFALEQKVVALQHLLRAEDIQTKSRIQCLGGYHATSNSMLPFNFPS